MGKILYINIRFLNNITEFNSLNLLDAATSDKISCCKASLGGDGNVISLILIKRFLKNSEF